jgi:acid phosphatase type 7
MNPRVALSRRTLLKGATVALCLPKPSRAATLVRQPYLQNVQQDRASILWTTQEAGSGAVTAIGADGSSITATASRQEFQPVQTALGSTFYQYQADLLGLSANTHYSYTVSVDGQDLASDPTLFHFRTAGNGRFSFLVFGDSGAASSEQMSLVQLMAAEPDVAMAVHVGDLAYSDGTFAEFETNYFQPNAPLMRRLPFFSTPGNHEYMTDQAAPYLAGVAAPASGVPIADLGRYYSFNWGSAHFVSLDSNFLMTSGAQQMLDWLDADLAATTQPWRIVFLHHPPYPSGYHVGDPVCIAVCQQVVPIVERHGVQLVLTGHEHAYERTYPLASGVPVDPPSPYTLYVITGGGGAGLEPVGSTPQCAMSVEAFNYLRVDVERESLRLRAIGLNGEEIDNVTLGAARGVTISQVLSVGGYTPAVASGSLIAIMGEKLATHTAAGSSQPSPGSLGGVVVTANGVVAPLRRVSPTEINAQLPYEVSGAVEVQVLTPEGSASTSVTVLPAAPSLLEVRSANRPLHFCNPVRPGAGARLYLTGLATLEASPGMMLSEQSAALASLQVWLGKTRLQPSFVGAEPGRAGVCRIDVAIPPGLADGLYALQVVVGSVSSRPTTLDVAATAPRARNDRALMKVEMRS